MAQKSKLEINKWRWGRDAFALNAPLGLSIPSYYDAKMENNMAIQNGVINKDECKIKETRDMIYMSSSGYSLLGDTRHLFPDESIVKIVPEITSPPYRIKLQAHPSNGKMPVLMTMAYDAMTSSLRPKKVYHYSPESNKSDVFDIKLIAGETYLIMNDKLSETYNNIKVNKAFSIGSLNAYILPESPILHLEIPSGISDSYLDAINGIIYTESTPSHLIVNIKTSPLFSYIPEGSISNYASFNKEKINSKETFTCLSTKVGNE